MKSLAAVLCLLAAAPLASTVSSAAVESSTAPASREDSFASGSVWNGKRFFKKHEKGDGDAKAKGKGQPWSLHIEKRDGEKFSGFIVLNGTPADKTKIAVEGTAPADGAGHVAFSTVEAKGEGKLRFSGALKNDVVELEFKGRSLLGEDVEGTAGLGRKK